MTHEYTIYITEAQIRREFCITGCEAAFNAYMASVKWVEAIGLEASVDMVDNETGEILASTEV